MWYNNVNLINGGVYETLPERKLFKKIRGFYHTDDILKVITGVRRCGKSSLMQTIADELKASGVSEKSIIYIDLDMRGNRSIKTAEQLEKFILEKNDAPGMKYLFVDEIQNVVGFEEVINGFRTAKIVRIDNDFHLIIANG